MSHICQAINSTECDIDGRYLQRSKAKLVIWINGKMDQEWNDKVSTSELLRVSPSPSSSPSLKGAWGTVKAVQVGIRHKTATSSEQGVARQFFIY